MAIIDIYLPKSISKRLGLPNNSLINQQLKVLKKMLKKARFTEFGQYYHFDQILLQKDITQSFIEKVPLFDYNKIYNEWWHKSLEGKSDICWPGIIKYYALSSGTSEASSKYIPITKEILRGNTIVMVKNLLTIRKYEDVEKLKPIGKGWLMLGGSTSLEKKYHYYAGDLSGISAKRQPFWFQPFYKPGKAIAQQKDWNKKLESIVKQAPKWDIGFITGVPAWVQMCLEMIIKEYHLKNIHEIWPNFSYFVHGGVSFEPYKKKFETLLGKPISYVETYLTSEGFLGYQDKQNYNGMKLVLNEHIFFEFIPFNEQNFDNEGNVFPQAKSLLIHEVEENQEYAIVISTVAGTWRYLLGDTVRFVDKNNPDVVITGRVKHFLSLVGEHVSVDNMNKTICHISNTLGISIPEFTVIGIPYQDFFAHHWYIASNEPINEVQLSIMIDNYLKSINDDYAVERVAALKNVFVTILPESIFMSFLKMQGKIGSQNKFPRVLKGKRAQDWLQFVSMQAKKMLLQQR